MRTNGTENGGGAVRRISHYSSDMDILLVGEGDFSFAAALARAFDHAPRLLATSLDSREKLHMNYGWFIIETRLIELSLRGAVVMNEVDVKTIAQHPSICHLSFDRIIYNFPHSGFVNGLGEYSKALIRKHQKLMKSFFKNIRRMLRVGGEVHVVHHTCDPYLQWGIHEEATKNGLKLQSCPKFEPQVFPGYTPRRGAGANASGTFPLHDPVTFIFFLPYSPPSPCIIPSQPSPDDPPCFISTHPCASPSITNHHPPCNISPSSMTTPKSSISIVPSPRPPHSPTIKQSINSHEKPYKPSPHDPPCFISTHPHASPSITIHHPPCNISPSSMTTPKSSIAIFPSPRPPHSPTIKQSINSHEKPYKPPPPLVNIPSHPESYQHYSSNHHVENDSFSWVLQALTKIIKFFTDSS